MKQTIRTGPKRRRWRRADLRTNQLSRWNKRPGNYRPNIERRERLAALLSADYNEETR